MWKNTRSSFCQPQLGRNVNINSGKISSLTSNAGTIRLKHFRNSFSQKRDFLHRRFWSKFDIILNNERTRSSGAEPIVGTKQALSTCVLRGTEGTENSFYNNWTMNNTKGSYCPKLVRASWNSFVFYVV